MSDDALEESFSDQLDVAKQVKNQAKQASIDSEIGTSYDEFNAKSKNLHEESIGLHTMTMRTNWHNPLGSSASCNRDAELIASQLNSKFEIFSENMTNKQH